MNKTRALSLNALFLLAITSFFTACTPAIPNVHCENDADCPTAYHCDLQHGAYCIANTQVDDAGSSDAANIVDSGQPDQALPDSSVVTDSTIADTSLSDASPHDNGLPDSSPHDSIFADVPRSDVVAQDHVVGDLGSSDRVQSFEAGVAEAGVAEVGVAEVGVVEASVTDTTAPDTYTCTVSACGTPENECEQYSCVNNTCVAINKANGIECNTADGQANYAGVCQEGNCKRLCFIDDEFIFGGNSPTGQACLICNPSQYTQQYSNAVNSTPCQADEYFCTIQNCQGGQCTIIENITPCTSSPDQSVCWEQNDRCVQCRNQADCGEGLFCSDANTCVSCLDDGDCDDGDPCTGEDTCSDGHCEQGGNPCDAFHPTCAPSADIDQGYTCSCASNPPENSCPADFSCEDNGICHGTANLALLDRDQDGFEDPQNDYTITGVGENMNTMELMNTEYFGGLRYQLPIPKNAHIINAHLDVYVTDSEGNNCDIVIFAKQVPDAPAMQGNVGYELSSINSGNSAAWEKSNMGVGWNSSPNFAEVVQQIVNQEEWNPENHMLILLNNDSSNSQTSENAGFRFYQFENPDSSKGAHLVVEWEF